MSKYRGYEKYKDSGVEWLGEIPEHWEVKRFKFLLSEPFKYGANEVAEIDDPNLPRYIRITDVKDDGSLREDTFRSLPDNLAKDYILEEGDILLTRSGATVGKTLIYRKFWGKAAYAGYLIRARISKDNDSNFIYKFLQSSCYWQWVNSIFIQATIQNISAEKYANLFISIPPLEEQKSIARFLDYKTKQIDDLIAKKQTLLEKLDEKRTALISQAVTKGLDSTVPMKDSGIEWLGEIPEHWEVLRVKHLTKILRGKFSHRPRNDPKLYDGEYAFIQTGDVANANKFITEYSQTLNEEGYAVSKEFPSGTLVMTIAANIGDIAILEFNACFPDSIVGFVPSKETDILFLYYLFVSMRKQFLSTAFLNTQLNLNIERISNIFTVSPPLSEQVKIVYFLDNEMQKIDRQKAKIQEAIELLKEYRTALITNAVTGKIDIRQVEVPPEAA